MKIVEVLELFTFGDEQFSLLKDSKKITTSERCSGECRYYLPDSLC